MRALVFLVLAAPAFVGAPEALSLDLLLSRMAASPGVRAEFREKKHLALLDAPLETAGTVYFAPPDRFARTTKEPAETRLVLVGNRLRFEDASGVNALDLDANPVARQMAEHLTVLWRGDRAALERLYRLEWKAEGERWQLVLLPRDAPLDRFIARISLRGAGPRMQGMEVVEADGDRTETEFTSSEVEHVFGADEARAVFGAPAEP